MNNNMYMDLAYLQAKKAFEANEVPVGAIIVKDEKVISSSFNKVEENNSIFKHAEILAIEEAFKKLNTKNLDKCKIFITLEPCLMCLGGIINSHIKEIYFASLDPFKGAFTHYGVSPSIDNLQIHFLKDDRCSLLISDFFKNKVRNN